MNLTIFLCLFVSFSTVSLATSHTVSFEENASKKLIATLEEAQFPGAGIYNSSLEVETITCLAEFHACYLKQAVNSPSFKLEGSKADILVKLFRNAGVPEVKFPGGHSLHLEKLNCLVEGIDHHPETYSYSCKANWVN